VSIRVDSLTSISEIITKLREVSRQGLVRRAKKIVGNHLLRSKDLLNCTYQREFHCDNLNRYIPPIDSDYLKENAMVISFIAENTLKHRFNLLGSGWTTIKYGMKCRGLEEYRYEMGTLVSSDSQGSWLEGRINESNLAESKSIWGFVDPEYIPIDWHLDFKSGYRWRENSWYLDISYENSIGVDLKVPWELARQQHHPQLAFAFALSKQGFAGFLQPDRYMREFRNQVLDFIATNPPRFGVNWLCTMDVAIRVVNWLVAKDLYQAFGAIFDQDFENLFCRSVYEHGLQIINNLEWFAYFRGNHYLSNIAGLLFVSAFLPSTPETDAWLAFAVQELISEVKSQFHTDGSNFEASTSYHRLSAEMVVYCTALVLGLPPEKQKAFSKFDSSMIKVSPGLNPAPLPSFPLPPTENQENTNYSPFPPWYFERLEKMAEFTMTITKPNGRITQIGDNDSGRFLKLFPTMNRLTVSQAKALYAHIDSYDELPGDEAYWIENHLDHRHLVAAFNGLFKRRDFREFSGEDHPESNLVFRLSGDLHLNSYRTIQKSDAPKQVRIGNEQDFVKKKGELLKRTKHTAVRISIPAHDLSVDFFLNAYPNFGLYAFRSIDFYLCVRCGPIGQNGIGGHAHNDQLSIELHANGKDLISDPGTYLYTPLPNRRNEYRSVKAHFAPRVEGREPGNLNLGLFRLGDEAKAECLYYSEKGFLGRHFGYGYPVWLMVEIAEDSVSITYFMPSGIKEMLIHPENIQNNIFFSPGYGLIMKEQL
jgi:hypothetical protein